MSFLFDRFTPISAITLNILPNSVPRIEETIKRGMIKYFTLFYCLVRKQSLLFINADQRCQTPVDSDWSFPDISHQYRHHLFSVPTVDLDWPVHRRVTWYFSVHIMERQRFTACQSNCPSHSQDEARKTVKERLSFMEASVNNIWQGVRFIHHC